MIYAKLYEIENDIRKAIDPIEETTKEQDLILSSIIFHYTNSYAFEKTFIGSALMQENGKYFVSTLRHKDIHEDNASIDANTLFASNFALVGKEEIKYENGFIQHCKEKYGAKSMFKSMENPDKIILKKILKDYPDILIPSKSYPSFSDYKGYINEYDGRRILDYPEMSNASKVQPLSIDEIQKSEFGLSVLSKLKEQDKYQIIFEQDEEKQKINLINKREHRIENVNFDEDTAMNLNIIAKTNIVKYDEDFYGVYGKLKSEGLQYIESIIPNQYSENHETLISTNNLGISGILIYAKAFYPQDDDSMKNIASISSIAVAVESRGQQLALKLFNTAAEQALNDKRILFRTTPSENGSLYLKNAIDNSITKNNYYHIISSDEIEKNLAEHITKVAYGLTENLVIDSKKYLIQKVENPFEFVSQVVKQYREQEKNIPLESNNVLSKYNLESSKRDLSRKIYLEAVELIKGDEIKNKRQLKP